MRGWVSASIALLIVLGGCSGGAVPRATVTAGTVAPSGPTSTGAGTATASAGPSATSTVVSSTTSYSSPSGLYTFEYPAVWILYASNGPGEETDVSNEQTGGYVLRLSPSGVNVTIRFRTNDPTPLTLERWAQDRKTIRQGVISGQRRLTVDGYEAIQQLEAEGEATGQFRLGTYIAVGDRFYEILMYSLRRAAIDERRADYDAIVSSFKVGS